MAHATTPRNADSAAGQAKEQVRQQAQQAGSQAKGKLREQLDQRSTQAGDRVGATAEDVRSVATELRKRGKDQPAKLAEQAADRVERLGGYLKESDADGIVRDIEDFGRSKPWAIAVGGLALGFAASRFLKASSGRRYQERQRDWSVAPRPALASGTGSAEPAPAPTMTADRSI